MVYLNDFICFLKITNNLLFSLSSRDDELITGKLFSYPENAYSKVSGNGLSSSLSGDFNYGLILFPDGANCSNIKFHFIAIHAW